MFEPTSPGGRRVIRATGRLVAGADRIEWPAPPAPGEPAQVVIDLRRVTAFDAAGVGALLRLRAALAAQGGRLALMAPPPRVRRVLQLTGLTAMFDLAPAGGTEPETPGHAEQTTEPLCRCA